MTCSDGTSVSHHDKGSVRAVSKIWTGVENSDRNFRVSHEGRSAVHPIPWPDLVGAPSPRWGCFCNKVWVLSIVRLGSRSGKQKIQNGRQGVSRGCICA